jgi:hypothetical protein
VTLPHKNLTEQHIVEPLCATQQNAENNLCIPFFYGAHKNGDKMKITII